ncbi:MAG: haloalkane dehalogenase [Tatlockia sp.]|nr:haloalkane dehalogenase [Tatlockia sp.]
MISAEERYSKHEVRILGLKMAYIDEGVGDPIIFLHGNPSSSYEWRNVIPHLVNMGRCIAPDLIGMGDSDKLPNSGASSYRFIEHRKYLDALLDVLGVQNRVTLVLHDWGSALGFDWAYRHPQAIRAIAYMESFVTPITSWSEWPEEAIELFQKIRSDAGEALVLDQNFIIESILPGCTVRQLSESERAVYRRPYNKPGESRRPTLTWPREIPIAGVPQDVHKIIKTYSTWLASSDIPKLFIEATPGAMFESHRAIARTWPNQTHVKITGGHFVQEDSPEETGAAIVAWLQNLHN